MNRGAAVARRGRVVAAVAALTVLSALGGAALAKPHKKAKKPRPAPTASAEGEGRSHLKKANALASKGDCKAAVDEYTLAFDRLNDPEVLLARAECFRKLGQSDEAVGDYRAYLDESPDVANKSEIEAKIAALEGGSAAPAVKEKPHVEPAAPVAKEKPRAEPTAATPPNGAPPIAKAPVVAEPAPLAPPRAAAPTAAPSPVVEIEVEQTPASPAKAPSGSAIAGRRQMWLWAAVAVLVAGGAAVGGYLYFRPSDPTTTGALGGVRF